MARGQKATPEEGEKFQTEGSKYYRTVKYCNVTTKKCISGLGVWRPSVTLVVSHLHGMVRVEDWAVGQGGGAPGGHQPWKLGSEVRTGKGAS